MAYQCLRGASGNAMHSRSPSTHRASHLHSLEAAPVHRRSRKHTQLPGPSLDGVPRVTRFVSLLPRVYGASGANYGTSAYSSAGAPSQFGSGGMMGMQQGSTALSTVDQGNTALKAKEQPKTVQVRFWLKFHVDYGQSIRIIGGHEAMGAWNLAKAPFLRWSEGDLWNVTIEMAAGGVYEYKYVVVESDGVTAASWQRGANNVLALQMNDEEVEVYDNWKNAPGALVLVDGQEITRERKLLAWAADMSLQRSELRRTRMELAQAREEIRVLRAELSVLRMEVSEANIARAAAEARQLELERANSQLRLEVAASQASARSTMEEAVRLLTDMSDEDPSTSSGGGDTGSTPTYASANAPGASSSSHSSGGGGGGGSNGGMFGGLFGFGSNGRVQGRVPEDQGRPNSAASAVVAAAAAMAAAADPWRHGVGNGSTGGEAVAGESGTYSPHNSSGSRSYNPSGSGDSTATGGSEAVSANASS